MNRAEQLKQPLNLHTRHGKPLGIWEPVDEEDYEYAFECLPPAKMWRGGFFLGERQSTTQETGEAVWLAFTRHRGTCFRGLVTVATLPDYLSSLSKGVTG